MNIDQIMFLILLCFGFIVFLYLLGCEQETTKENKQCSP